MTSNVGSVRLFARFPQDYENLAIRTSHQDTRLGPCLLVFDHAVWEAWMKPYWVGNSCPPLPGHDQPCTLCGQQMACLDHGPGALALWQGEAASTILEAMDLAEAERGLSLQWAAFCENASTIEKQEYVSLAEGILQPGFKGFSHLPDHLMDWQSHAAADVPVEDDAFLLGPEARKRRVDHALDLLAVLGVWVPSLPAQEAVRPAVLARQGAERLLLGQAKVTQDYLDACAARRHAEQASRLDEDRLKDGLPAEEVGLTSAEELADALSGYDHLTGQAHWALWSKSMLGHNSRLGQDEGR